MPQRRSTALTRRTPVGLVHGPSHIQTRRNAIRQFLTTEQVFHGRC
jgi:hypothetical protein